MEVVEVHCWVDGLNLCDESIRVYFIRRLLHQNIDAFFRDRVHGEANQDGENEGANGIGDFPVRSEKDERRSDDDPDRHNHVAQSMKISGIYIYIRLASTAALLR